MKRFLLTACAGLIAAAMASPSFAADLPRKAPIYVAPFSWTGFYVGLNAGYGWGHSDWNNAAMGNVSITTKGALLGGTIGYNLQTGAWVWGLEGDLDASWINGSSGGGAIGSVCATPNCKTENKWLATTRGRIGYAWDRFLPYITGGAAFGDIKATGAGGGSIDKVKVGWTVGAGVEYAFLGAWSTKFEYLYADLGTVTCDAGACGINTTVSLKTNIVKLGVNYRF